MFAADDDGSLVLCVRFTYEELAGLAHNSGYTLTPTMFRKFVRFGFLQKAFELSLSADIWDVVEDEVLDFCRQSVAIEGEEEELNGKEGK